MKCQVAKRHRTSKADVFAERSAKRWAWNCYQWQTRVFESGRYLNLKGVCNSNRHQKLMTALYLIHNACRTLTSDFSIVCTALFCNFILILAFRSCTSMAFFATRSDSASSCDTILSTSSRQKHLESNKTGAGLKHQQQRWIRSPEIDREKSAFDSVAKVYI